MGVQVCSSCGRRVVLRSDGTCPSCRVGDLPADGADQSAITSAENHRFHEWCRSTRRIWDESGPDAAVQELHRLGLSESQIRTVTEEVLGSARREEGGKNMAFGALWCAGGGLLTLLTYSAATVQGGTYIICYGAIIFGGLQFLRGLAQYHEWSIR